MTNGDTPLELREPMLGDIAPDEFRRQARRVLQWIGDYLEHPDRFPVSRSRMTPARRWLAPGSVVPATTDSK